MFSLMLVLFNPLAGHSVYDAVSAWVHVPQAPRYGKHSQGYHHHGPQDDVEKDGVVVCVVFSQVQCGCDGNSRL